MKALKTFIAAALTLALGVCAALTLPGCSVNDTDAAAAVPSSDVSSIISSAAASGGTNSSKSSSGGKTPDLTEASSGSSALSSGASQETQATPTGTSSETSYAVSVSDAGGLFRAADLFTQRDLTQTADLSEAISIEVTDGEDVFITEEGVYLLSGSADSVTVYVEAEDTDKVQLVLSGLSITNSDFPCIYVKEADKVFITLQGENALSVTGSFVSDGNTNTDAVIFSRSDLVLNGTGSLSVYSTDNGISCKDDLKITGGSYTVSASSKCFEANDSIRIAGGTFLLTSGTDGLHAENDDDDSLGYVCIFGGSFSIDAGDDGIHAVSVVQIDDGDFTISAAEGIEATYIQLNGGTIDISGRDDGINAAQKSSAYRPVVEINGGDITIIMGAGDTDGVDSNGDIIINGGTVNVTGNSTFDYDGSGELNGGTVIVNGQEVSSLPNQFMGGMGGGPMGGKGFRM